MAYGVDECRVCGARMQASGPVAMERYRANLKKRTPTMTEEQWRAAGFKASPTQSQIKHPDEGCCTACRAPMALKGSKRLVLIAVIGAPLTAAFFSFLAWLFV